MYKVLLGNPHQLYTRLYLEPHSATQPRLWVSAPPVLLSESLCHAAPQKKRMGPLNNIQSQDSTVTLNFKQVSPQSENGERMRPGERKDQKRGQQ